MRKSCCDRRGAGSVQLSLLKGTQGVHWLKPVSKACIQHKPYFQADASQLGVHFFSDTYRPETDKEQPQSHQPTSIQIGSFVRVKFLTKKSEKFFVAQITCTHNDGCTVKFLKRQGTSSFFVYSEEEESFIEQEQIMELLPAPIMDNRDRYCFQDDVEAE